MKIERTTVCQEHLPLTRPYTIATGSYDSVTNFLVEIRADGLTGRGIASPEPDVTGETVEQCAKALQEIDWLSGQKLDLAPLQRDLKERMTRTPAARAGVDIALYDLWSQALGKPLVEALGRVHQTLPTSITIGIMAVEATLAEAAEYLERGFHAFKVKLGLDLDQDIERLQRLHTAYGEKVTLRVDLNQGYSRDQLLRFVEATCDLNLELIEEPLPAGTPLGDLPVPLRQCLVADESLIDVEDAQRLAEPPAQYGIFNIKLMKCGGIKPALSIAETAAAAGIRLMWGCMDESRIGIAAALHAALACPATRYLDLDGSLDLARDVVTGGVLVQDGYMHTLDLPGLGVNPAPN